MSVLRLSQNDGALRRATPTIVDRTADGIPTDATPGRPDSIGTSGAD